MRARIVQTFQVWIWHHTPSILIALCLLLGVFIGLGSYLPGPSRWKGYYTLLIETDDLSAILARMKADIFREVVSEPTAQVKINSFSKIEKITVSQIPNRLQPEDPRFDGYLHKVYRLFHTEPEGKKVLYFPIRLHPAVFYFRMLKSLPEEQWDFLDWNLLLALLLSIFFMGLAFLYLLQGKSYRFILFSTAVFWLFLVSQTHLEGVILSVLSYFWIANFFEDLLGEFDQFLYYGRKGRIPKVLLGFFPFYFFFIGFLILITPLHIWAGVLYCSFLSFLLVSLILCFKIQDARKREHRLFLPLRILPAHWQLIKFSNFYLGIGLLSILPLLCYLPKSQIPQLVPTPASSSSVRIFPGRNDYKDLFMLHKQDPLPNVSDFIVHVKYQLGFPFGASYNFPSIEEVLEYPRFHEKEGKLLLWQQPIVIYDQTWSKETLKTAQTDTLGKLLYLQGVRATVYEPAIIRPSGNTLLVYYLILCFGIVYTQRVRFFSKAVRWVQEFFSGREQQEA
ncbi:MAG: hypothetical protein SNJ78_03310 [Spirochaetales bacterium]